jgi:hypothetical protein
MAYLTIARMHGDPDLLLDAYRRAADVMDGVGLDHGLILHTGAATGDGLLVVNLWPSRECSEAAADDPRRLALLARAPVAPERIRRVHHEVERYVIAP